MRGDLQRDISVQARVVAALHPTLFSPAQGIISIKTKAGTQARKGDVLATIESTELRSSLAQAQSLLISQRADLERQKIVSRQTELRARAAGQPDHAPPRGREAKPRALRADVQGRSEQSQRLRSGAGRRARRRDGAGPGEERADDGRRDPELRSAQSRGAGQTPGFGDN